MSGPTLAITVRPAFPAEEELLFRIYASTRTEELAQTDWSAAQQEAFLRRQSAAQLAHYRQHYPGALFALITANGRPIGRLFLHQTAHEHRLMDIALFPEWRGRGIGSSLTAQIIAEADAQNVPASLHVERFNPAYRLYTRLGFREVEERGVYVFMIRPVGGPA
jgi:ribosomal protein S18 acetylase RimI-like enzyme